MRKIVRSFVIGYLAVPLPFYLVNILGHLSLFQIWFPFALTIALVATTMVSLTLLYRWRQQLGISAPLALTLGATLGLLHWFAPYAVFGQFVLWEPVRQQSFLDSLRFAGLLLAIPVLSLSGATYDGSVVGIVASVLVLCLAGLAWRQSSIVEPESDGRKIDAPREA